MMIIKPTNALSAYTEAVELMDQMQAQLEKDDDMGARGSADAAAGFLISVAASLYVYAATGEDHANCSLRQNSVDGTLSAYSPDAERHTAEEYAAMQAKD